MIRTQPPGARKGADFLAHVSPAALKAAGVEVVFVYLKNTTKAHIKGYHDAGISVGLIHQRGYEGRGPNPAAAGALAGREAAVQAAALGYPKGLAIIFASMGDYDNTAATIAGSSAYWNAAAKAAAAGGYQAAGQYADWDLLAAIGSRGALNCQAAAKSWSFNWVARVWRGVHPTAHMVQYPSKVLPEVVARRSKMTATQLRAEVAAWPGTAVDLLDIVKPILVWSPGVVPSKAPVIVPTPTLRLRRPRMRSTQVGLLQQQMKFWGWYPGKVDNEFGPVTTDGVRRMQRVLKVADDGVYGPITAAAFRRFATAMRDLVAGAK